MSSLVTNSTNPRNLSNFAHNNSAKPHARDDSPGSEDFEEQYLDSLEQEFKMENELFMRKQAAEKERHKKVMVENKNRIKAQEQRIKESEANKRDEKFTGGKNIVNPQYNKNNSKLVLPSINKKDSRPSQGDYNDLRDTSPRLLATKAKSNPVDLVSSNNSKAKPEMHGKMSNTGYMNSIGEKQKVFGNIAEIRETEEFDTSHGYGGSDKLNNFDIIVEQYHKDMEDEEKRQKQIGKNVMASPSQLPKIQPNRIGESLNLGSSLIALKPGQQKPKIVNSVVKTQAQVYGTNQNDQDGQKQDMEKFGEDFEDPEEDGDLMNNIDDFEKKLENNKKKTKQVKSAKTTESKIKDQAEILAQRESDKEWFLSFINDKKKQNGKQEIFQSPKGIIGNSMNKYASHGVVNISTGSDLRSIGNLVNYDRTPGRDSVISNGLLKKEAEHKVENSIKYSEKNHEISAYAGKGENQQIRVKDDFVKNLQTQLNQKNSSQEQVLTNQHVSTNGGKVIGSHDPCHSDPEHNANIQRITKENEKETGKEPSASYNGKFQGKPVNKVKQKLIQPEQGQTMKNDKKPPLKGQRPMKNIAVLNKGEKGSVNMKIQQLKPKVQSHVQVNYPGKKTYTLRTSSPGTKETRETNFTHEDVHQENFQMLNEEEANLQNEIMSLHLREMGKVREIEHKHNIQPSYKSSTRQMARQHQEYTPYFPSQQIVREEELEESLDKLDHALMKPRNVMPENQGFMPLNNPMNYQYPSSYQVPSQFQRDPPFYQQNKPRESPGLGMPNDLNYHPPQMNLPYQSHTNNGFNKAYNGPYHPMANTNYPPINKALSQGDFNGFAQYPPMGMQNNPYGQYGHQNPPYQPQPRSYPQTSYFPGYENNQPDINNPFRYPQEYQSTVVNQYNPLNNPYQYPAHQHQAQRSHYVGYEQSHGGASRGSSIEKAGSNPSLEKTPPRKGSRGLSQHQRAYGSQGANEVKTFTFTRNVQSNVLEVEKLKEAMEGLDQHNPSETSTMSRKTLDPLSEAGKAILKGGGARSTIREESINYAVKRLQRKEYHTKKPSRNFKKREEKEKDEEIEEDKEEDKIKEIINGDVRLVANTGLMHLLVDG